jgi:hypothetical protein
MNERTKSDRLGLYKRKVLQGNSIPFENIKSSHMLLAALAHLAEGLDRMLLLTIKMGKSLIDLDATL